MSDDLLNLQLETNNDDGSFRSACELIEGKFGEFLELMPDGILICDSSGKIVLANRQAEKMFGFRRDDLVSQMVESLVPIVLSEDHVIHRMSFVENTSPRPVGQGSELFGLHRDGHEFPVEIRLSTMGSDVGLLFSVAVRDISERMQVEDALSASEEQVCLLLDSTYEAIYGLDLQGNCTFCNQACLKTLGYRHADELLGQNMHDLIHHTRPDGSHYPMHECRIYEAFRFGKGTHVDYELLWRADGSSFAAEYRSFPVRRDGELVGSVVTFFDITDQKRVEEALRMQQSELTHAARLSAMGEMAAGLAHELNQPLMAMSAYAEGSLVRLGQGKLQEQELATVFSRIAEDAQRAGDIIRRLRNFVQKSDFLRSRIDINRLILDVYKFVEADAIQKDILIEFELRNELTVVEADPIEIQQVLLNLIRNAYDSLAQGESDERKILISSFAGSTNRVEVVVEDSGPGIPDSITEQVFEPFFSSKNDGLGIGLGICQNIIEAHGGKIWLERSSIGGAGMHFNLPSLLQEGEVNAK